MRSDRTSGSTEPADSDDSVTVLTQRTVPCVSLVTAFTYTTSL